MIPHMKEQECMLFLSFLRNSDRYLEFGSGGSTILASCYVKRKVISVESSLEWLNKVREEPHGFVAPDFFYINIGSIGNWGTPIDSSSKDKWVNYHSSIWDSLESSFSDLYFIDGRFRVACFAQICLHCKKDVVIGIHDFASRQ